MRGAVLHLCREVGPFLFSGRVVSSRVSWAEWSADLRVVSAETSLDDGRSWWRAENGAPIPGLAVGDGPGSVRGRLFMETPPRGWGSFQMPDFRLTVACDVAEGINPYDADSPIPDETADGDNLSDAANLLYDALEDAGEAARGVFHNRGGDVVDGSGEVIAEALLAAGWSLPNPEPCIWCEHRTDRHSPGGCHDGDCRCTMPHGGS